MKAAIITPGRNISEILDHLSKLDKDFKPEVWPDISDPDQIQVALIWRAPEEVMEKFSNLKLICSFGAGVDHILFNSKIESSVLITRLVDPELTRNVTKYCLLAIFAYEKNFRDHIINSQNKKWEWKVDKEISEIGIIGLGVIGKSIAYSLRELGYNVNGYSLNPKKLDGVHHYCGPKNLKAFLQSSDILVNAMPLTTHTRNFFSKEIFEKCRPGSYFINLGRGQHVIEQDLLEAIETGALSGATLDVFNQEPLPKDHVFWDCKRITITPHIAGLTLPKSAAFQFYENFMRFRNNQPILNLVDRSKEY